MVSFMVSRVWRIVSRRIQTEFLPRLFDTVGGDWPGLSYNFVIKTQSGVHYTVNTIQYTYSITSQRNSHDLGHKVKYLLPGPKMSGDVFLITAFNTRSWPHRSLKGGVDRI